MELETWMAGIRRDVDEVLTRFFEHKCVEAKNLSPHAEELVVEVQDLTMRGGKRLRPVVTAAAYRAVTGSIDATPTLEAGASLELLQSYLLIHDDWMDEDDERRGGPAVHFAFAQRHGDAHLGASLGVLAGDLASTFSWELFLMSPIREARRTDALRLFIEIHKEVFAGQQLDLVADRDVELMHRLKTGSYTTRGPAELGGVLGGASDGAMRSLRQWSLPLGVAFQLRDDLLGTFSGVHQTGKPGDDLRHGKHNAVMAAFRANSPDKPDLASIERVWGRREATDLEVERAREVLGDARTRVEARLNELVAESEHALAASEFSNDATHLLGEVTRLLTDRGT
ncbi:MAG: polyprenyl synthetase family protein [Polyangiales bacterium]